MLPIRLQRTPHADSAHAAEQSVTTEALTLQRERRRLFAQRLRALDDLADARRWAQWTDSRAAALAALDAGARLGEIDGAIVALDAELAAEVGQ